MTNTAAMYLRASTNLAAGDSKDLSLEYPMQAITLIVVIIATFAAMLVWSKWNKKKRR